jgi:plasmid stability protein
MASVTIKNIPDELYDQLKESANAHHRSINSELIVCLERVLMPAKVSAEDRLATAKALRAKVNAKRINVSELDSAKRVGRP